MAGVFGFGSCGLESALEEVNAKSPAIAGQPATKTPKIPIIVDVFREPNDSRNTSREQVYNQTAKKYVILYSIVNVS